MRSKPNLSKCEIVLRCTDPSGAYADVKVPLGVELEYALEVMHAALQLAGFEVPEDSIVEVLNDRELIIEVAEYERLLGVDGNMDLDTSLSLIQLNTGSYDEFDDMSKKPPKEFMN